MMDAVVGRRNKNCFFFIKYIHFHQIFIKSREKTYRSSRSSAQFRLNCWTHLGKYTIVQHRVRLIDLRATLMSWNFLMKSHGTLITNRMLSEIANDKSYRYFIARDFLNGSYEIIESLLLLVEASQEEIRWKKMKSITERFWWHWLLWRSREKSGSNSSFSHINSCNSMRCRSALHSNRHTQTLSYSLCEAA